MAVEPQEPQTGSDHTRTKNCKFTRSRHVRNLKINSYFGIARQIGENQEHEGYNKNTTNGQAIKTIGEIHGVRAAYNCQDCDDDPSCSGAGENWILVKRNHYIGNELGRGRHLPKIERYKQCQPELDIELDATAGTTSCLLRDLRVIVVKAERGKYHNR